MKKIIVLQLMLCCSLALKACKEEKESYWVLDGITKEDGKAMTGITLAFMEVLRDKQIHIHKADETLEFVYPMTKQVTESQLKSITDLRVAETGQLIDSVYKVVVSEKELYIKFYYIGTAQEDKRFSMRFARVGKEAFYQKITALKKADQQITDKLKTTTVPGLDLNIPVPDYFNEKDLTALSPMQGLDLLFGVKSDEIQPTFKQFGLEDSAGTKGQFVKLGIDMPVKAQPAARFEDIAFNGLEFIRSAANKTNVITLRGELDKNKLLKLYEHLNKKHAKAYVNFTGLPESFLGEIQPIMEWFSIFWRDNGNIIKLQVRTPEAIYKQEVYNNLYMPEHPTSADIKKVFLQYANLVDTSDVRVYILSEAFEKALETDRFHGSGADLEDYRR